jgi:hypothetical protein
MKNDETLIDCSFEVINILNKVNERSTARTKIKVNEPNANTVGILDSICSAMSYVAGFTTCIYAWIEYLAYSFCIAGVTGIGCPCYLWLLLCS